MTLPNTSSSKTIMLPEKGGILNAKIPSTTGVKVLPTNAPGLNANVYTHGQQHVMTPQEQAAYNSVFDTQAENYWRDPGRLNRYYTAINTIKDPANLPNWLDTEAVKVAYQYLAYKNQKKPWYEWTLPEDKTDPVYELLDSLPTPPNDKLLPYEQMQFGGDGGEDINKVSFEDMPKWQQAYLSIMVPGTSENITDRPESSRLIAAGVQSAQGAIGGAIGGAIAGGAIGAALGLGVGAIPGAIIGAIALGGTSFYQAYSGQEIPVLSELLGITAIPREGMERIIGTARQIPYHEMDSIIKDLPSIWQASKGLYESSNTDTINLMGKVLSLGKSEWAADNQIWRITEGYISPQQLQNASSRGVYALNDAAQMISEGVDPEQAYAEIAARFGDTGATNNFAYQSILDPMLLIPYAEGRVGEFAAKAAGKPELANAFKATQGNFIIDALPIGIQQVVEAVTGVRGSQGTIGALQQYRGVVQKVALTGGKSLGTLDWFDRMVGGITKEGYVKELLPLTNKTGIAGVIEKSRSLTAESKATLYLDNLLSSTSQLAYTVDDIRLPNSERAAALKAVLEKYASPSTTAVGDAGETLLKSPMTATTSASVKGTVGSTTFQELFAGWMNKNIQNSIDSLNNIAAKLGESPAELVGKIKLSPDDIAVRIRALNDASLADLTDPVKLQNAFAVFTGKRADGIEVEPQAFDFRDFRARALNMVAEGATKYLIDHFGIKEASPVIRMAGLMKSVQSALLLDLNPGYLVNNALNNIVTRGAVGVLGFMTKDQIEGWWDAFGSKPARLAEGFGATGDNLGEAGSAFSTFVKQFTDVQQGKGSLAKLSRMVNGARSKFNLMTKLSGRVEGAESVQAYTIGTQEAWNRLWQPGVGYSKMSPQLETQLREIDPNLPDKVYRIINSGMNAAQIDEALWNSPHGVEVNLLLKEVANEIAPATADVIMQMFSRTGVSATLAKDLLNAKTEEQVKAVFDKVRATAKDAIENSQQQDVAGLKQQTAARIQSEGALSLPDLVADSQERLWNRWMEHYKTTSDAAVEIMKLPFEKRNAAWKKLNDAEASTWTHLMDSELQVYAGASERLAGGGPNSQAILKLMRENVDALDAFFNGRDVWKRRPYPTEGETVPRGMETNGNAYHIEGKNELYNKFFAGALDPNMRFEDLERLVNQRFDELVSTQRRNQKLMDDILVNSFKDPAQQEIARNWRSEVAKAQAEMDTRRTEFRQLLADTQPNSITRNKMWLEFMNQTYLPLINKVKSLEVAGVEALSPFRMAMDIPIGAVNVDAYTAAQMRTDLIIKARLSPKEADRIMVVQNALASYWARKTGRPIEEFYASHYSSMTTGNAKSKASGLHQDAASTWYYSPVTRAVENIPGENLTIGRLRSLLGKAKGITADEMEFTNLKSFLDSHKDMDTVTKAEVLDFLDKNQVTVDVRRLADTANPGLASVLDDRLEKMQLQDLYDKATELEMANRDSEAIAIYKEIALKEEEYNALWWGPDLAAAKRFLDIASAEGSMTPTQHTAFDILGELEDNAAAPLDPNTVSDLIRDLDAFLKDDTTANLDALKRSANLLRYEDVLYTNPAGATHYAQYSDPTGTNYQEFLFYTPRSSEFMSPHFGNEGQGLLSSARTVDSVGPNGEKILNVQELQSDLQQKVAKEGAVPAGQLPTGWSVTTTKGFTIQDRYGNYPKGIYDSPEAAVAGSYPPVKLPDSVGSPLPYHVLGIPGSFATALEASEAAMQRLGNTVVPTDNLAVVKDPQGITSIYSSQAEALARVNADSLPAAPFLETYPKMMMKHLINYAVANGYDQIAWTTGQQQFDLWGSAEVSWKKRAGGDGYDVAVSPQRGGSFGDYQHEMYVVHNIDELNAAVRSTQNLLEDKLVPEKIWKRMEASPDEGTYLPRKIGMEEQYDKKYLSQIDKYIKQYGSEVKDVAIGDPTNTKELQTYTITDTENNTYHFTDVSEEQALEKYFVDQGFSMVETKKGKFRVMYDATGDGEEVVTQGNTRLEAWQNAAEDFDVVVLFDKNVPASKMQHGFDITPEMKKAAKEGQPLFQNTKGTTDWDAEGKAVVKFLKGADVSTALHEGSHVWLRSLATSGMMEDVNVVTTWLRDTYGMKLPDDWAANPNYGQFRKAHETFARAFERYMREGKVPTGAGAVIVAAFHDFKTWLKTIYSKIKGSEIDIEITPELRKLFDSWMTEGEQVLTNPQRAPLPVPMGDVLTEGYKSYIEPVLDSLQQKVMASRASGNNVVTRGLTEQAAISLKDYLTKIYRNEMPGTKAAALNYGEMQRDSALLNYHRKYGFDTALSVVFPYQFWYTRSMANWALRMIDRPAWYSYYAGLKDLQNQYEEKGIPNRLRGRMRFLLGYLPEWAGGAIYIDPLKQLFPFEQLAQPLENFNYAVRNQQYAAKDILKQMVANGEIDPTVAAAAAQDQTGPAWETAILRAQKQTDQDLSNPATMVGMMMSPAMYLTAPYYAATGQADKISATPFNRFATGVQAVTENTPLQGLGSLFGLAAKPEQWLRNKAGIKEFGAFNDYYVDKALSGMAADGTSDPQAVIQAMIDKSGPVYEEAVKRVRYEKSLSVVGVGAVNAIAQAADGNATLGDALGGVATSIFPAGLWSEGEMKYVGLYDKYTRAWEAYNNGNHKAVNDFFDQYPEYEARIAQYKEPEARLRNFLVGQIWDSYNALEGPNKAAVVDQLGEQFVRSVLDDATRDTEAVDVETLAYWAKTLGGAVPTTAQNNVTTPLYLQEAGPDLYSYDVNQAVQDYWSERDKQFPNITKIQEMYYKVPGGDKGVLQMFPQLKDYWAWNKQYKSEHPQVEKYADYQTQLRTGEAATETTTTYTPAPAEVKAYWAERDKQFPGILTVQNTYYDQNKDRAYLAEHPELKRYWEWNKQYKAEHPEVTKYQESGAKQYNTVTITKPLVTVEELSTFDPVLIRQLLNSVYTGQSLTDGARTELYRLWVSKGKPGTFPEYLSAVKQTVQQ